MSAIRKLRSAADRPKPAQSWSSYRVDAGRQQAGWFWRLSATSAGRVGGSRFGLLLTALFNPHVTF
jgi:hypothetical protein